MIDLYNGDCFEYFEKINDNSVDMVCVDPPYGSTTIKWDNVLDFNKMWEELERVCKPNANIVIFGSQPFSSLVITSKLNWFRYELIWNKNKCGSPGLAKYRPLKVHENIMVFNKNSGGIYNPIMEKGEAYSRVSKDKINGYGTKQNTHGYGFGNNIVTEISNSGTRNPKSILHCSRNFSAQQTVHPTQKPVSILAWLIMTYSNIGDTVLDFTMGSGSTGVAAKMTSRNFIGIEQNSDFFNIAKERIDNSTQNINETDFLFTTQISTDMKTVPDIKFDDNAILDEIKGNKKNKSDNQKGLSNDLFE